MKTVKFLLDSSAQEWRAEYSVEVAFCGSAPGWRLLRWSIFCLSLCDISSFRHLCQVQLHFGFDACAAVDGSETYSFTSLNSLKSGFIIQSKLIIRLRKALRIEL